MSEGPWILQPYQESQNKYSPRYIGKIMMQSPWNKKMLGVCIFANNNLAITCASNIYLQEYMYITIYQTSEGEYDQENSYYIETVKFPKKYIDSQQQQYGEYNYALMKLIPRGEIDRQFISQGLAPSSYFSPFNTNHETEIYSYQKQGNLVSTQGRQNSLSKSYQFSSQYNQLLAQKANLEQNLQISRGNEYNLINEIKRLQREYKQYKMSNENYKEYKNKYQSLYSQYIRMDNIIWNQNKNLQQSQQMIQQQKILAGQQHNKFENHIERVNQIIRNNQHTIKANIREISEQENKIKVKQQIILRLKEEIKQNESQNRKLSKWIGTLQQKIIYLEENKQICQKEIGQLRMINMQKKKKGQFEGRAAGVQTQKQILIQKKVMDKQAILNSEALEILVKDNKRLTDNIAGINEQIQYIFSNDNKIRQDLQDCKIFMQQFYHVVDLISREQIENQKAVAEFIKIKKPSIFYSLLEEESIEEQSSH